MRLSNLTPRSLRTRLLIFVILGLLLTQAATFFAVSHYRRSFLDQVTPELIATSVQTLRIMLAETPQEEREELVRHASRNEWRLRTQTIPKAWHRTGKQRSAPTLDRVSQRLFASTPSGGWRQTLVALNNKLGDGTQIAISKGDNPSLFISLRSDNQADAGNTVQDWLVIPLERLRPPLATTALILWLGGFALVLTVTSVLAWNISRPLTRLTYAAEQLAQGNHLHVKPSGPSETQALARQFNTMIDALSEADSVRRTLLAGLPHDLKGPLSRMRMRTELCEDEQLKSGLRNDLHDMQKIIDQFINYVRGTDPRSYQFIDFDFDLWLHERIQAWKSTDLAITLASSVNHSFIHADPTSLSRLLDNIIHNALQHGAPPIHVKLDEKEDNFILAISDSGTGIPEEDRKQALQPFARLDKARTRTGNVGLGLALVDVITQVHGGHLELLTAQSGGLCIQLHLPKAKQILT